jgi:hypothetical protein
LLSSTERERERERGRKREREREKERGRKREVVGCIFWRQKRQTMHLLWKRGITALCGGHVVSERGS